MGLRDWLLFCIVYVIMLYTSVDIVGICCNCAVAFVLFLCFICLFVVFQL